MAARPNLDIAFPLIYSYIYESAQRWDSVPIFLLLTSIFNRIFQRFGIHIQSYFD